MLKAIAALKLQQQNDAPEEEPEPVDPYKEIPYGVDLKTRMGHIKARRKLFATKAGGAVAVCGSSITKAPSRIIIERRGIPHADDGVGVEQKVVKALNPWTIATMIKTRITRMRENMNEKTHEVEEETKEGPNENLENNEETSPEGSPGAANAPPVKSSPWKRLAF